MEIQYIIYDAMKKLFVMLAISVLLASCSTLPGPHTADDSLVIGYFSLYFPGGFFDTGQSSVNSGIELDFRDITTGGSFAKFLYNGHFAFVARGGDTYELVSSRADIADGGSLSYILGPRAINLRIEASPGRVLYLGNVTVTYTEMKDTLAFRPEVDYKQINMGGPAGGHDKPGCGAYPYKGRQVLRRLCFSNVG